MAKSDKKKKDADSRFFLLSGNFWAHTMFKVLIAALVVASGWMTLAMARDKAVRIEDFHVSTATLDLVSKPEWVKGTIEQQVKSVPSSRSISLLDADATRKVAAALSSNPWVQEVTSVVREFPNRIRAEVQLRDPSAYVLRNGKYYIVDGDGVRLPGEYTNRAEPGLDLLMIVYVRTAPPAAGMVWDDPAVVEGARVAAALRRYPDVLTAARITAIDTSNIGGRRTPKESEIVLITAEQTQIYWGRGVNTAGSTELTPDRKIQNLKAVLAQEGGIADKEYVDLRFPNPVFRDRRWQLGSL